MAEIGVPTPTGGMSRLGPTGVVKPGTAEVGVIISVR